MVIALLISLLLHLILFSKFGAPSQPKNHTSILQVNLNPESPLISNKNVAIAPVAVDSPPQPVVLTKKEVSIQKAIEPTPQKTQAPSLKPIEASSEPAQPNKQTMLEPMIPLKGQAPPARWVEIEFDIYSGPDRKLVDRGLHHFESDEANNYQLSFKQIGKPETTSPEIAKPVVTEESDLWLLQIKGAIYRQGLGPSIFSMQGSPPEQLIALSSTTPDSSLPTQRLSHRGRFPDAILDQQSLLYQFMFTPPTDLNEKLLLSDGKKITSFSYHVADLGVIDSDSIEISNLGKVRTMHLILTTTESSETIELWLAPDFRFLPLKVRHTNADGFITEQLATSLNIK